MVTAVLVPTSAMKRNHATHSMRHVMVSVMVMESSVEQIRAFSSTVAVNLTCMIVMVNV